MSTLKIKSEDEDRCVECDVIVMDDCMLCDCDECCGGPYCEFCWEKHVAEFQYD